MKISVEITLTPLQDDFEAPIISFIKALRKGGFTVLENPLSTQIYGDYDRLMTFISDTLKTSFEELDHVVATLKIVKSDRSSYEPHF